MQESRLRRRVRRLAELGVSRRYMQLLLEKDAMTRDDVTYVEQLSRTLRLDEEEKQHVADRRDDAGAPVPC